MFSGTHSCFIPFSPWQKVKQLDDYILDVQISPKWTFFLLLLKNTSLSPNKHALESSMAFDFWKNLIFLDFIPEKSLFLSGNVLKETSGGVKLWNEIPSHIKRSS